MNKDIIATDKAAKKMGLTYGAYVAKYGTDKAPKKPTSKLVHCLDCGVRVSQKYGQKKYCEACRKKRQNTQAEHNAELYRRSYKRGVK